MTPDGRVDFIGDPATGPPAHRSTWPPAGATMVDVPGVEVAVVDASGRLRGARERGSRPFVRSGATSEHKPASLAATTTPGELLLTWSGSGCDRRAIVTIDEALSAIAVERIETPSCEGEARLFGLLLTFDEPGGPIGHHGLGDPPGHAHALGVGRLVGEPAAGDRDEDPARQLATEERRVLAARRQALGCDEPRVGAIEDHEVRRRAFDQPDRPVPPRSTGEHPRRTGRQRLDGPGQRQLVRIDGREEQARAPSRCR